MMALCFIFNFGLAICLAANGVMAMGHNSNKDNAGVLFVAGYMIIFGFILGMYELLQLCTIESVDLMLKKNVGFLYGAWGKCFYLFL